MGRVGSRAGGGLMSRVVLLAMLSLDGIFDGPGEGGERVDWMRADEEWLDYSVELLDSASTLLFGWRTFEGMSQYWPHQSDPVAQRMNTLPKVAFSRSPHTTDWSGASVSADTVATINELRRGGDDRCLLVMGSGTLADSLTAHGLIDEYRLAFNPVVLGAGTPLFLPGRPRLNLDLAGTRVFTSGIVELRCTPRQATT
jgi:dihydrofolate reductase